MLLDKLSILTNTDHAKLPNFSRDLGDETESQIFLELGDIKN